jgi:hypothetical protein
MAKRIVFSFDDRSLDSLEQVKVKGRFQSLGTAVRESIQINQALHDEASEGFTEVVVRNPKTRQEKTLIIPSLKKTAAASS